MTRPPRRAPSAWPLASFAPLASLALVLSVSRTASAQWQQPGAQQPGAQWQQPGAGPPAAPPGQLAPAPQPAPQPYDPSMQAGGLAPPPPMNDSSAGAPPPGPTEQHLERSKEEDSGRGLTWFWIDAEGGFQHVGLSTFSVNEDELTAGFIASTSNGGVIGAGLGFRLLFLTIGGRGRVGFFDAWQLFSAGGEVGIHIPIGNLEPRVDLGFGYAGLGNLSAAVSGAADAIEVRGFYGRVAGGLDYFVTPVFSIGAGVSWELLGLTRPGVDLGEIQKIQQSDPSVCPNPDDPKGCALRFEQTSYGSSIAITAMLGLHF